MHSHTRLAAAALAVGALALTGCTAVPSIPDLDVEELETTITETIEEHVDEPAEPAGNIEGLSQEAIDQGYTVVQLPSGWPSELPLPDGVPVTAFRSGGNFSMIFDVSSPAAGQEIMDWYQQQGWSVEGDFEMDSVHVMEFGSPETNDYGPLRRVTVGLGMTDWPTGFQYSLTVQDQ